LILSLDLLSKEILKTAKCLKEGGVVLYPTDTIWGLGCSAFDEAALHKIYEIKNRPANKSVILLVDSIERLCFHVGELSKDVVKTIHSAAYPTTIIYPKANNLPNGIVANNGSIGIRLVDHAFCQEVIKAIDAPLVSTSANLSRMTSPISFKEISIKIKEKVDLIVEETLFLSDQKTKSSRILKLNDDHSFTIIRN